MTLRLLVRLAALGLAASAGPLIAQPIELLGDLPPAASASSGPAQIVGTVNGKALLYGFDLGNYALWASDGTAAGTLPIADLTFGLGYFPVVFTASPQRTYLVQFSGGNEGHRVLRTDGTRSGTYVLRSESGAPLEPLLASAGGAATAAGGFYVYACAGGSDCGIWFTDGTTPTAHRLVGLGSGSFITLRTLGDSLFWTRDHNLFTTRPEEPGSRLVFGASGSAITGFTVANGRLYFVAASTAGDEAWSSDGTTAGTVVLTAFANATPFGFQVSFHASGGRVYFLADDVEHGEELWSTDGTAAGTRRETDFGYHLPFGGRLLDDYTGPELVGGRLVFAATDGLNGMQLWSKAGNVQPVPLLDACGPDCSPLGPGGHMLGADGRVYFVAADPNHGYEPWSTDGTKAGTRLLVDACPGSCGNALFSDQFHQFVHAGSRVFLWTSNDVWVTDGSPGGTRSLLHDSNGALFATPFGLSVVAVGDRYLFPGRHPSYGEELFVTDGSPESVEVLTDLISDAGSSRPTGFTSLGARAVFSAGSSSPFGSSLWGTDGTPGGTVEIPDAHPAVCDGSGQLCAPPVAAGELAYFHQRDEGFAEQLWRTDGTVAGTVQLTSGAEDYGLPARGAAIGNTFYFVRLSGGEVELWSSDGTAAGTQARFPLPGVSNVQWLTSVDDELYFVATDGSGPNAWRTDGTPAGTRKLTTPGHTYPSSTFVRAGGAVWFLANGTGVGDLWRSDGTAAGTHVIANPNSYADPVSFQGRAYFFAQANPTTRALWRVNDQQNGIEQVALFPGGSSFFARGLTVFDGSLYFLARTAAEGLELWRSDGTAAGTHLVRDIFPGPDGSGIEQLTVTPQGLFFGAADGVHGWELWRSDGTSAGTHLVQDLWPGPTGSFPSDGGVAANHLVFAATDEGFGREPRSLDLGAARTCIASDTALCLDGNRFHVTATWKDFAGNHGAGHAFALTTDTGYFWFFGPENVEVVIKVLDGHGVNGHDWVFYGALSSVEYTLTVTDTQTGAVRRYFNPSGRLASVGDTQGFGPLGAYARTPPPPAAPAPAARRIDSGDTSPCVASATRLCLNGGRFAVEAAWKDFAGHTGVGHARVLTGDTGYFWFFSDSNVEVVIKVLDGTPLNGKFWLFYGALSSVEYTLTVRDTVTGAVRVYRNVSGNMASVADTSAF